MINLQIIIWFLILISDSIAATVMKPPWIIWQVGYAEKKKTEKKQKKSKF